MNVLVAAHRRLFWTPRSRIKFRGRCSRVRPGQPARVASAQNAGNYQSQQCKGVICIPGNGCTVRVFSLCPWPRHLGSISCSGCGLRAGRPGTGSISCSANRPTSPNSARKLRRGCTYGRLARLDEGPIASDGVLFVTSCSQHTPLDTWAGEIARGLHLAPWEVRVLLTTAPGRIIQCTSIWREQLI